MVVKVAWIRFELFRYWFVLNIISDVGASRCEFVEIVELVSKELNQFGSIAGLIRQIRGHNEWFVLFALIEDSKTMIKSVKVFSFWKSNVFFFNSKNQTPGINMQNGLHVIYSQEYKRVYSLNYFGLFSTLLALIVNLIN